MANFRKDDKYDCMDFYEFGDRIGCSNCPNLGDCGCNKPGESKTES